MTELSTLQKASVYNQVYPLQKPDYSREVTEASAQTFVLVLLTSSSGTNPESQLMLSLWHRLATTFGDLKFCQMQGNLCIDGYPDRNTPTILVYKDGEIRRQIVTLKELKGDQTGLEDVEGMLVDLGAVKHGDSRLQNRWKGSKDDGAKTNGSLYQTSKGKDDDEDDSDWE